MWTAIAERIAADEESLVAIAMVTSSRYVAVF